MGLSRGSSFHAANGKEAELRKVSQASAQASLRYRGQGQNSSQTSNSRSFSPSSPRPWSVAFLSFMAKEDHRKLLELREGVG